MKLPEFETIELALDGPLGRVRLNRPERLNAVGATMMRDLIAAAAFFDGRLDVRVVIVSGAGRAFCAGADLQDSPLSGASRQSGRGASPQSGRGASSRSRGASPPADRTWAERRELGQLGLRMADALEGMRAVTIARVHGYAVGGGLVLAAVCDLRVAAEDAVFSIPEIELGIPLAWGGIPRLVREIGPALTKELVMTCRRFTPAEAKAAGFLNRVVPAQQLDAEVEALAAQLLAMPSVPVTITKEHVNSVARAMGAGTTAFADGDALLSAAFDPESLAAAERYLAKTVRRNKP